MKSYDVYLSFCHEDSRSFVLGIYTGFTSDPDVVVFWDDQWFESEDRRSKQPSDSTLNVIGNCEMAVIIFSNNYFNSRWCLQELEKITQCCQRTTNRIIVVPVFYHDVFSPDKRMWVPRDIYGGEGFHGFADRISKQEETSSQDGDKFMNWIAVISYEASKYRGSKFLPCRYE